MAIASVDVSTVRQQMGISTPPSASFSEVMSAMSPAAASSAGIATGNGNVASLTNAAITGASVAAAPTGAYGQAYGVSGLASSPFSSGGYTPPTNLGSGYSSAGYSGGAGASVGATGGLPTDPFMQQDYLLNKMRDTNMQMITIQAEVQGISREFQTFSNIQKAKYDSEMGQVRNIRIT